MIRRMRSVKAKDGKVNMAKMEEQPRNKGRMEVRRRLAWYAE
jgi:hypothetical protein